jgi:hypothetical protein
VQNSLHQLIIGDVSGGMKVLFIWNQWHRYMLWAKISLFVMLMYIWCLRTNEYYHWKVLPYTFSYS